MQLSKRLEAVASMVTSGYRIADIGTDHAYIPIALVKNGRVPSALAMDVNKGPLQKAVENIETYGLEDRIKTRLSDGLHQLKAGEADSIIIAGMGGPLTVRILTEGEEGLSTCRELILQPQSDIRQVRAYLEQQHWKIVEEKFVLEEGKYYPMMKAVRTELSEEPMSPEELRYGPLLLARQDPSLAVFLAHEKQVNEKILSSLEGQNSDTAVRRRAEVCAELEVVHAALKRYASGEEK